MRAVLTALLLVPLWADAAPLRASDVLGRDVVSTRGEQLGEVKDVIFDSRDGAIRYVTIEFGPLGLGSKEAAFTAVQLSLRENLFVLNVSEESLARVPAFDRVNYPAMRLTRLLHQEVLDRLRRDAGEIVDLVLDLEENRVKHAIIDVRDDWQPGTRLVRAPIEAFSLARDMGDHAVLNIERDRLERIR